MGKPLKNNPAKVILRIVEVRGKCRAGHEVGQEFDLGDGLVLGYTGGAKTLCPSAYNAIFPGYRVLRHGGIHPFIAEKDEDVLHVPCPDPFNIVVLQLRRIDEPETRFPRKGQENW